MSMRTAFKAAYAFERARRGGALRGMWHTANLVHDFEGACLNEFGRMDLSKAADAEDAARRVVDSVAFDRHMVEVFG